MRFFKYFSIIFVIVLGIYFLFIRTTQFQEINGRIFGTYYNVKIRIDHKDRGIALKIQQELNNVNKEMSVFEPDSEINHINEAPAHTTIALSENMSELLKNSQEISRLTQGNFDPTVGLLVDLWGFGTNHRTSSPTPEEITQVKKSIGYQKLHFDKNYKNLSKDNNTLIINLSAIAKGYAVDRLTKLLRHEGYKNFVIEIGGEIYTSGVKSIHNQGWNIGIALPKLDNLNNQNALVLRLSNIAIATSGDYRNYYYKNNKRYSHTISPQTGYPVAHNLASATVLSSSCMEADALATAFMVMGEEKGIAFANRHNIAVIFFVRNEDNTFKTEVSKAAKNILRKQKLASPLVTKE